MSCRPPSSSSPSAVDLVVTKDDDNTTPAAAKPKRRTSVVYFVRHAEATHNIKEREAVALAVQNGIQEKEEQEKARKAVLQDESLRDAPLSANGESQVRRAGCRLSLLTTTGCTRYPKPKIVFCSPLRRALRTATILFGGEEDKDDDSNENYHDDDDRPTRFIAMEALREKRTGYAADERSSVDVLEKEFPHVEFSDLRRIQARHGNDDDETPVGEDNAAVRERGRMFWEGPFTEELLIEDGIDAVALVSHKGWLRELRHTLKGWVDSGRIQQVDFDIDQWDEAVFSNSEIRVAEFNWTGTTLTSIVSKSVENALASVVGDAPSDVVKKQRSLEQVRLASVVGDAPSVVKKHRKQ